MKTMQLISTVLFVVLIGNVAISRAEDIDIYSGTVSNGVPNVMFVVDNPSSQNNNASPCTYTGAAQAITGTSAPSNNNKALGQDQCALANIVADMAANVVNLGITTVAGVYFKLTPINDSVYAGTDTPPGLVTGTTTNRQAFILAVKALAQATGKSGQGSELQETWAYYTGGNDGSGSTGTGILSGTDYSSAHTTAPTSCAKNYIIYLSNVDNANASHPQQWDSTEMTKLTSSIANAVANGTITADQGTTLGTKLPNMPSPIGDPGEGREWARFMRSVDINTTPAPVSPATTPPEGTGLQSIITYSVATGYTAVPPAAITHEMENYIKAVASYGGGKYYPAGDDSSVLQSSILKILNEVQAVNSVFSSSSLPVSVNAQGTYLNQIYMGMFRPDQEGNPRWVGNLKQYHFVATRNLTTHLVDLSLGDSLDVSAINPATGFISPNAVSYWTCGGSPSVRACSPVADVTGGFWVNDSLKMADSAGKAYDLPDGEWVDKGGAAQIVRLANLTADYTTAAGTSTNPRNLYTCTGTCSATSPNNLLSSYPFANSNASLTAASFGIITPKTVTSLTRDGATATATTSTAHGVTDGQVVQVSGSGQSEYNGSFVMTYVDADTVTYTITPSPVSPATGTISATPPGAPIAITSLTRAGTTVTVTAPGNTLLSGDSANISGVTPTAYNGTWTVNCGAAGTPCSATSFTFTGPAEGPATPSGGGSAAVSGYTTRTIETATANPDPGFVRAGTLVTVKTTANHGFPNSGTVTISGAGDSGYNGIWSFTKTGNRTFTFSLSGTTPATPATVTGATVSGTVGTAIIISSLAMTSWLDATTATVTATTTADHGLSGTPTISISGAAQSQYNGTFSATVTGTNTFTYLITTAPVTPATGTITLGSSLVASDLINWVRGDDNAGDESGPGGSVTIRPSLHGDVLHSRPVTVNYGGATVTITDTADSDTTRTATASAADVAKIGTMGAQANITFANGDSCTVTVASATTFTYSTTGCGAAVTSPQTQDAATGSSNVVVFYGSNDGVYRAVNGNQTNPTGSTLPAPGAELWGFIPTEFFSKLKRLHDNSPILDLPSTIPGISPTPQKKDYFADGSPGIYQKLNANGTTNTAYLYISMRRGGRLIYALDVTDPAVPKYLWKITNTGDFAELGQTWSAPKVALIKGYNDGSGNAKPVVIFGAGYDTAEDTEPVVTANRSMGRGIYIVDAVTGALVWSATKQPTGDTACSGTATKAACLVSGMNYSIPADITLMDRDSDGYIDRLYAVDVGGNVWRVDLQREGNAVHNTPDYWRVNKVASLGGSGSTLRKFFYAADVVPTTTYDAVIVGSGDREHPLIINTAAADKQNRIFMLKDLPGDDGSSLTTIVKNDLFEKTSVNTYTAAAAGFGGTTPNKGYFIDLADGEKVVNAPLTVAGYTYFGTNQPTSSNSCSANLGIARGYRLDPLTGTYTSTVFAGGGLPPSPVAGVVSVTVAGESGAVLAPFIIGGGGDPNCVGADCSSALGGGKPTISVPTSRTRTYWYQEID